MKLCNVQVLTKHADVDDTCREIKQSEHNDRKSLLKEQEHSESTDLRQGQVVWKNALSCNVEMHTIYLFIVVRTVTAVNSSRQLQATSTKGVNVCNGTQ